MSLDQDDALKLIAICVALSAYIGNVRRDIAKRSTALRDEIAKLSALIAAPQGHEPEVRKHELEKAEKEAERAGLRADIKDLNWGDVPLVLASLAVLWYWASPYIRLDGQVFLIVAKMLFCFAVFVLAVQHFRQWRK